MADPARPLYNFYFRYKWNEVDFAGWQGGMIGILRDSLGSIFGPALISGGAGSAGAGMSVDVAPFVAVAPSGFVNVTTSITNVLVTSDPSNPRKDLIVARKNLVDNTFITRPTSPFDSVPLKQLQESQVIRIPGTPAGSPAYPSKVADDVVLFGVTIPAAAVSLNSTNIDNAVTELLSGNTNFSNWVVGKDVHGTAAITGDSSATREALTVVGGNSQAAIKATGGTNSAAVKAFGAGSGSGIEATGGATGAGITATGGATSGAAVVATASGGNSRGVTATGIGSAEGIVATGGTLGAGVVGISGATTSSGAISGQSGNLSSPGGEFQNSFGGVVLKLSPIASPTLSPVRLAVSAQPSGASVVGDMYMASGGVLKVCTVAGTPGTWVSVGTQT